MGYSGVTREGGSLRPGKEQGRVEVAVVKLAQVVFPNTVAWEEMR